MIKVDNYYTENEITNMNARISLTLLACVNGVEEFVEFNLYPRIYLTLKE